LIRLGIIGGGMAVQKLHWPALSELREDFTVVALARRNYEEAKAFAARTNISRLYKSYHQLLQDSDLDAVLTAVPIELNGTVLRAVLDSGKHVMAEKPIAATLDEARVIVQRAETGKQLVLIGENLRYRRDLPEIKDLLGSGAIGDVFAFKLKVSFDINSQARRPWVSRGWRHEARHPGGFILDAGVHPVAALREVLGEVSEVWARTLDISPLMHGPDSLLMQVRMESGVEGHCFFCYTAKESKENPLDFVIYGSKGVLHAGNRTVKITRGPGMRGKSIAVAEQGGEYLRQWQNFCAAIRGEQEIVSTARKAYGDLAVIDAALRSSSERRPCLIKHGPGVESSRFC
jgi:predicted dehydrogenase